MLFHKVVHDFSIKSIVLTGGILLFLGMMIWARFFFLPNLEQRLLDDQKASMTAEMSVMQSRMASLKNNGAALMIAEELYHQTQKPGFLYMAIYNEDGEAEEVEVGDGKIDPVINPSLMSRAALTGGVIIDFDKASNTLTGYIGFSYVAEGLPINQTLVKMHDMNWVRDKINSLFYTQVMQSSLILFAIVLLIWLVLREKLDKRLSIILKDANKLAEANTSLTSIPSGDELGVLSGRLHSVSDLLAQRLREVREALKAAEAGAEAKSRFLANMSHEIRTPMTGVMGMLRLARESDDVEEKDHCIDIATTSSQYLLTIINDILDFSKLDQGKTALILSPDSIESIIKSCVDPLAHQAAEKGVELHVDIPPDLPNFMIDSSRMTQVLYNLIGNAVKFTEVGRIDVVLDVLRKEDAYYQFEMVIKDTGPGIPKDQLPQIFDRFSQAYIAKGQHPGGTGLGLAIVKEIAELSGGDVSVTSEVGKGTCFRLTFSMTITDEVIEKREVFADANKVSGHILVAEDVAINQAILRKTLEKWGMSVVLASNGEEAVEAVNATLQGQAAPFDFVLLDIQMPVMDGVQALQAIRKLSTVNSTLPVAAITANSLPEDVQRYRAAGFDDVLEKPIDFKKLKSVLMQYCGG